MVEGGDGEGCSGRCWREVVKYRRNHRYMNDSSHRFPGKVMVALLGPWICPDTCTREGPAPVQPNMAPSQARMQSRSSGKGSTTSSCAHVRCDCFARDRELVGYLSAPTPRQHRHLPHTCLRSETRFPKLIPQYISAYSCEQCGPQNLLGPEGTCQRRYERRQLALSMGRDENQPCSNNRITLLRLRAVKRQACLHLVTFASGHNLCSLDLPHSRYWLTRKSNFSLPCPGTHKH